MVNLLAIPTYFTLGSFTIALVDIIALVVLLIFLIAGATKGFAKQILSLLGIVAAIAVAIFTCKYVASFVIEKFPALETTVEGWFNGLIGSDIVAATTEEELRTALAASSIPTYLHELIVSLISKSNFEISIISVLANWTITAISFLVILIVSLIVFRLIKKIFNFLTKLPVIGTLDKLLGLIFGVAKGLILLILISIVLNLFHVDVNSFMSPVLEDGTSVTCYFNKLLTFILSLPFLQNLLASVMGII